MPRKPSLDGKDSSLRIRMSPEQKRKASILCRETLSDYE